MDRKHTEKQARIKNLDLNKSISVLELNEWNGHKCTGLHLKGVGSYPQTNSHENRQDEQQTQGSGKQLAQT